MPKRPSNHPKTDLSTGLGWWTSHLQSESRADDWWDYYETYDVPLQYKQPKQSRTGSPPPAKKLADVDIPGTDAWIKSQAAQRRKGPNVKPRQRSPEVHQPGVGHLRGEELEHHEPQTNETEAGSHRTWILWFQPVRTAVRFKPPKMATTGDWEKMLATEPQGTALYEALRARVETLHARLALGIGEQGIRREVNKSLFVRLSRPEFEELYWRGEDLE
ncbi:MAG: hypothetical protein LQ338_008040 [Usnochroma carphineum]|nr:MAG: hypothetical protein LQ338_008040 [Usnochroma carphineum]